MLPISLRIMLAGRTLQASAALPSHPGTPNIYVQK